MYENSDLQRQFLQYICEIKHLEIIHLGWSTFKGVGITIENTNTDFEIVIEILNSSRVLITIINNYTTNIEKLESIDISSVDETLDKIKEVLTPYI